MSPHAGGVPWSRGFRASRGSSIGDCVDRIRVEHARRLLATEQPVKTIAYSLGFASPSAFAHAFHRATGEAPRQFRQRILATSSRLRAR